MQIDTDLISIVIPVCNEQDNLLTLYNRLKTVLENNHYLHEIIFVDDGSKDDSWECIEKFCAKDSSVKGIQFSRNFGQQFALSAGIDYAHGNALITMDADLQHAPEMIPQLIEKWKEGYDIVYTIRKKNEDANVIKKFLSDSFCAVINKLAGVTIPAGAADFRLFSDNVVEGFKGIHERARFFRGIVSWMGYRNIGIPYVADKRFMGKSKYSFIELMSLALTAITSFSSLPLYVCAYLGLVIAGASFFYAIFAIYEKFFTNNVVPGWTSVLVSVLFLGGIQLIAIGVLGGYLARVYEEVKQRPLYLIAQKRGF